MTGSVTYPPTDYRPLTIEAGGFVEFGDLFRGLRTRWVKVEFLQSYDETGSEAFEAYLRGDDELAASLVARDVKAQWVYEHAREFDVDMVRIRVYQTPLSSYLSNFEYHAYLADEEMGESVFVVHWDKIADLIEQTGISDFLVFDDTAVVALVYDVPSGTIREARLVTEPSEVGRYLGIVDQLMEAGEPLANSPYSQLRWSQV